MKIKLAIVSVFILSLAVILLQCRNKTGKRLKHDFTASDEFKKLSRSEQVEKCGSCHKEIYENEMAGPHANAYKNLQAHIAFIESDAYDYATYKKIVSTAKEACIGCHASKNMYESIFTMGDNDYEMTTTFFGKKRKPRMRDEASRMTGIDCITCHFDGEAVITGTNFESSDTGNCPGYCNPVASPFFSSIANCAPCHMGQFKGTRDFNEQNKVNLTCASCHEEKNPSGKYTHYTYWAHNPPNKLLPDYLNLFTGIRGEYLADKNVVKIIWKNNLTPHEASHCTELAAIITILDDSLAVAKDTIRLNRKTVHVENMSKSIDVKEFPGTAGLEFKGLGDSIVKFISLPLLSGKQPMYKLSLLGIKKEQYWLSDSIHTKYYQKIITL
jgi:hypothetical protein